MFYPDPMVGAKCSHQNPKIGHVRVDVAKVGSQTSNMGFERYLC